MRNVPSGDLEPLERLHKLAITAAYQLPDRVTMERADDPGDVISRPGDQVVTVIPAAIACGQRSSINQVIGTGRVRGVDSDEPYVTELWSVLSAHELLAILRQPRGPVRVTAARVESYCVLGLRPNLVLVMAVVLFER